MIGREILSCFTDPTNVPTTLLLNIRHENARSNTQFFTVIKPPLNMACNLNHKSSSRQTFPFTWVNRATHFRLIPCVPFRLNVIVVCGIS